MNVTLRIILSSLKSYKLEMHPLSSDREFYYMAFLLNEPGYVLPDTAVYVAHLSLAIKLRKENKNCVFLCDDDADIPEAELPQGVIKVCKISLTDLLSVCQYAFNTVNNWIISMQNEIKGNCDYGRLLSMSEKIIGNPVYVLDSSFKLVAYTKNIYDDDPLDEKLIKNSFHSEESIAAIKKSGRLRAYAESKDIIINRAGNPNKYQTVNKWMWQDERPVFNVIMVCKNAAPDDALVDLFKILCDAIFNVFKRTGNIAANKIYAPFVFDIIRKNLTDKAAIETRCRALGLLPRGILKLYRFTVDEKTKMTADRIIKEIENRSAFAKTVRDSSECLVLFSSEKETDMVSFEPRLAEILKKNELHAGASPVFADMTNLAGAYSQCVRALNLGSLISQIPENCVSADLTVPEEPWAIYNYEDYMIYDILRMAIKEFPESVASIPEIEAINRLRARDEAKGSRDTLILRTYLRCECNAAHTAELLFRHRNNILYRIGRIEEITGLDLKSRFVRERLRLGFRISEVLSVIDRL